MYFNIIKNGLLTILMITTIVINLPTQINAKPIYIVSITDDFAAIAKTIGGEFVKVDRLVKGSKNLHNIHPKPSMVMKIKKADLLLRLGMQQDAWIDGLIQVARNKTIIPGEIGYIDCSTNINKLEVPTEKIDGSMGDIHKAGNPHYWLNPKNGKIIAKQIQTHLSQIDPKNKATFQKNYVQFAQQLDQKMIQWQQQMTALKNQTFITYHKVWTYFFDAFDLTVIGHLEPLPGIPPTTKHLRQLNESVKKQTNPPLIITSNYYPSQIGTRLAQQIKSSHHILEPTIKNSTDYSYIDLFDTIIASLTQQ